VVESSALLKRRSPKGYRGFESLPHRQFFVHHCSRINRVEERPASFHKVGLKLPVCV